MLISGNCEYSFGLWSGPSLQTSKHLISPTMKQEVEAAFSGVMAAGSESRADCGFNLK